MRWRALLLLLLALLLPVRGALAAAMLCAVPTSATQAAGLIDAPPAGPDHHCHVMAQAEAGDGGDTVGPAEPSVPSAASGHGAGPTGCHACAGNCCLTALAATPRAVALPVAPAAAAFPALSVPVERFLADGQDRPPRRC